MKFSIAEAAWGAEEERALAGLFALVGPGQVGWVLDEVTRRTDVMASGGSTRPRLHAVQSIGDDITRGRLP